MTEKKPNNTKLKSNGTEIVTGTAKVEPQFRVDRHNELFVKADSFPSLIDAIKNAQTLEEQLVNIHDSFNCYPLDGINAVNVALARVFGFTKPMEIKSFFGTRPPLRITIQTGVDSTTTAAFGQIAPPSLEGGIINIAIDQCDPLSIIVASTVKRKFEPKMREVVDTAKRILVEESIYRQNAVELDLSFITNGDFNPQKHNPRFMAIDKPIKLILPRDIDFIVRTHILDRIINAETLRSLGVKMKKTYLVSGKYGTGKSLLARQIAQIAIANGKTFFYLKTPENFVEAYRLATLYKAVLFVEDIDAITGGERDYEMNQMLEALDGIAAKQAEVITILTTNHPEKIHKAFRRSGRIDRHIKLRPLDSENAARFLIMTASDLFSPDVNVAQLGEAFCGLVPADVAEAIDEAKCAAYSEHGANIANKVTQQTFLDVAEVVRHKYDEGEVETKAEHDLRVIRQAHFLLHNGSTNAQEHEKVTNRILNKVSDIQSCL